METQDTNNVNPMTVKKDLILGEDFENALISAAEVKNNSISNCKERNKTNYGTFFDIMLGSRIDVQEAMTKKGKAKTDKDKDLIKEFKTKTSQTYKQVCDLITPEENIEEGDKTKVQKMVEKITTVLKMMAYIGKSDIEDEFSKAGIKLSYKTLEEENEMFSQEHIRNNLKSVFETGKTIRSDINRNNEEIKTNIYESSVPIDLQYDKNGNPTGLKSSDFCKLVEIKAKMLKAKDNDEAKEKLRETVENIAGDYMFQNARNTLMNDKLMDISV